MCVAVGSAGHARAARNATRGDARDAGAVEKVDDFVHRRFVHSIFHESHRQNVVPAAGPFTDTAIKVTVGCLVSCLHRYFNETQNCL